MVEAGFGLLSSIFVYIRPKQCAMRFGSTGFRGVRFWSDCESARGAISF